VVCGSYGKTFARREPADAVTNRAWSIHYDALRLIDQQGPLPLDLVDREAVLLKRFQVEVCHQVVAESHASSVAACLLCHFFVRAPNITA
jgi:hypothetical protein